eukprot:2351205-Prymnesium_polylepis.1
MGAQTFGQLQPCTAPRSAPRVVVVIETVVGMSAGGEQLMQEVLVAWRQRERLRGAVEIVSG